MTSVRIPILMYHSLDTTGSVVSVTPSHFATQMACLADLGFRGVSLGEAVSYAAAHGAWPVKTVVLTFDDGYANFCDAALPALQQYGFAATVFVVSGHMGRSNDWAPPPPGLGAQGMLSVQQVRELAAADIEIGAHTRTHPDLQGLSVRQTENEIVASRRELEKYVGHAVESFAYPFGHLTKSAVEIVQREFRAACTTVLRRAAGEPLHQLPRIDMYYIRSRDALTRLLNGRLDTSLAVRRWARAARGKVWRQPAA